MEELLDIYGNASNHGFKYIDIEHVLTLYVMDMVVNMLGRDHVDPFILRNMIFDPLIPVLNKYPKVREIVVRWLHSPDCRSDECLHRLRELENEELEGEEGA